MESSETRSQLDQRLALIQTDLTQMIETVATRVGEVTSAMLEGDIEAADGLIAGDDEIDLLSLRVEEGCVETLIREQPVASDLRFVVAAIHMNSDVERSGDLVANIAKAVGRLQGAHPDHHVRDLVARMSSEAQTLLRRAAESFVARDAELAASIDELDDLLDDLHYRYIQHVISDARRGDLDPQQSLQLALVGRFYERTKRYGSALFYYNLCLATYPDNEYAKKCAKRAEVLKGRGIVERPGLEEPKKKPA